MRVSRSCGEAAGTVACGRFVADSCFRKWLESICFLKPLLISQSGSDLNKRTFVTVVALFFAPAALAAPVLHTTDFISTESRTNYVDFEPLLQNYPFPFYSQDGVDVNQIDNYVVVISAICYECWGGDNDTYSWFPSAGDLGYTQISKNDGTDFINMGLDFASGWQTPNYLQYELRNDGVSVLNGWLAMPIRTLGYVGFSGGGFDQVLLRSTLVMAGNFGDETFQGLVIDNIELSQNSISVPEPASLLLLSLGIAGVVRARRTTSS